VCNWSVVCRELCILGYSKGFLRREVWRWRLVYPVLRREENFEKVSLRIIIDFGG
jgi:hypothetical protein